MKRDIFDDFFGEHALNYDLKELMELQGETPETEQLEREE